MISIWFLTTLLLTVLLCYQVKKTQTFKKLSYLDHLTGLLNRRGFDKALDQEFKRSQRLGHPFTLLSIDLDHFKRFNDTHGHPAGDKLLQSLAAVFKKQVREIDLVSRTGGEEFIVLLLETDKKAAYLVAERIRQAFANESPWQTISLGIASYPADADTITLLLQKADRALYQAKEKRNCCVAVT